MKKEYKAEIIRIVSEMDNAAIIASIYSFIMGGGIVCEERWSGMSEEFQIVEYGGGISDYAGI